MSSRDSRDLKHWALGENTGDIATLAVVFTDIVGSTSLNHSLGDAMMNEVRDAHFATVEPLYKAHSGYLVTDLGDGYLLVFHTVIHAFDFVLQLRNAPGHQLIAVHAGVSVGLVTIKHNTVYGETVSFAARLEGVAKRDEICVCTEAKSHIDTYRAPRHSNLPWKHTRRRLKGFPTLPIWVAAPEQPVKSMAQA